MYRGRLIFPMLVSISRLDTVATAADPDGAGVHTSGYDADFREPVQVADGTQAGRDARVNMTAVNIPAQIEDQDWKTLSMEMGGNDPRTTIICVFHLRDLEARGYVDATTGIVTTPIVGDRLDSIRDPRTGAVMRLAPTPGIFCTSAIPRSYGLRGLRGNLVVATFMERGKTKPG